MRAIKLITGIAGAIALAISVPLLIGGTALFAWAAGDNVTELPRVHVRDGDAAIASGTIDIDDDWLGELDVPFVDSRIEASGDQALFLGVANSDDVDAFLATGDLPSASDIWVVSDEGASVTVDWDSPEGEWTVVLMNADGSQGVDATITAAVPSAPLRVFGGLLGLAGLGVGTVGMVLVASGWGRTRGPQNATPQASAA